jgi:hypothetical protein
MWFGVVSECFLVRCLGRGKMPCSALMISTVLFGAANAADLRPAEEHSFLVSGQPYFQIYERTDAIAANIRRRYGTAPFDFPSAASCLKGKATAPATSSLDWDRILSIGALEVCLTRALNRFSEAGHAGTWLASQGFKLDVVQSPNHCGGESRWFSWSPGLRPGPEALWAAQTWLTRRTNTGIALTVDACFAADSLRGLDNPRQSPPFHTLSASLTGRFEK